MHYNTHRNVKHLFNSLFFSHDRRQQHKRRITIEFKPGLLAPAVIPILLASFSLLLQFTARQKRKLPKNCCNYLLVSSTIGVAIVTYNARCVFYGDHINLVNSLDISYQLSTRFYQDIRYTQMHFLSSFGILDSFVPLLLQETSKPFTKLFLKWG